MIESKYKQCGSVIHNCYYSTLYKYDCTSLKYIFLKSQLVFIFKIMCLNYAPPLKELLAQKQPNYSLRNSNHLKITRFNKKLGQNSFSYWAPALHNKFISDFPQLFEHTTIQSFKKDIQQIFNNLEQ